MFFLWCKSHNLAIGYPCNSRICNGVFHEDVTYQHPLFNNLNNNHYLTNFSTNNRSVSASDQLNGMFAAMTFTTLHVLQYAGSAGIFFTKAKTFLPVLWKDP